MNLLNYPSYLKIAKSMVNNEHGGPLSTIENAREDLNSIEEDVLHFININI